MSTAPDDDLEPPPFDEDAPVPPRLEPGDPLPPLSAADLEALMRRPYELRTQNPWLCVYNINSEDGFGYYTGSAYVQCPVAVADPTRSRYCLEHARALGADYYSPAELAESTDKEVAGSLTRLVPKAVKTLENVMDDEDAPQGVRAKAADSVLDRTGYQKGIDVRMEAQVAVLDVTGILKERLDSLKEAQLKELSEIGAASPDVTDETPAPSSSPSSATPPADPPAASPDGTGAATVVGEIIGGGHGNTDGDPS